MNQGPEFTLQGPSARAPVVHLGRYHVLTSGRTSVVLDGARGMSVALIGEREDAAGNAGGGLRARLGPGSFQVELNHSGKRLVLDQANDPVGRLEIISQGPTHASARAFFSLCSADGRPCGTGTLDIIVYENRVHLIPSLFVDDLNPAATVVRSGLTLSLPETTGTLEVTGKAVTAKSDTWSVGFGEPSSGFDITLEQSGGRAVKLGWLRNQYPPFMYLREVDQNPETDDLYERWPLWITQRGSPLGWRLNESSGLEIASAKEKPSALSLLWVRGKAAAIPAGGYSVFNAPLVLVFGRTKAEARARWEDFSRPLAPAAESGDFRYYNEIEGVYEVDSRGRSVSLVFDGSKETTGRTPMVRLWNLDGSGAHVFRSDGEPTRFTLMNDGDLIDDPMVFIVKDATGPARSAMVSVDVPAGKKVRLTGEPGPGLQLAYQMHSDLETYEAWSDRCDGAPLFRFHLKELAIYQATYPGARDYAFFKLPLYFMKNGTNPATFMTQVRDFEVRENGPDELLLAIRSVTPGLRGLSSYTCRVPNAPEALSFEVTAEFVPLDDGRRWTSLEYCDLYPFEDVYRRNFHYREVTWLNKDGVFDRVGSGAWSMRFETVEEPGRPGFHSQIAKRQGPGSKVPLPGEGQAWLLGNNAERGNILFRRGRWDVSADVKPVFSLCNAWVDVHNSLGGRTDYSAVERVSFAVDIFPGAVPGRDVLNGYLEREAGAGRVRGIKAARFSPQGEIIGFVVD
ncbi:MAG: hypothetical protein A2W03_00560 [Candidatus Aminicenantes bacterium RBG_16_63_16]|nr:MAG: hypothetical protein A2W03_00560 [Candidatus Aminicenantes bacterium RBG_16_63_16]